MRLHLAGELLEHQVLVLHLGDEPGGLEQPLAVVPAIARWRCRPPLGERRTASLGGDDAVLMSLDEPVVLGVEDVVDGGQADVLVGPAVTGDEVRVEHLVVVRAGGESSVVPDRVGVGRPASAVSSPGRRHRVVGDVVEERVAGRGPRVAGVADRPGRRWPSGRPRRARSGTTSCGKPLAPRTKLP